MEDLISAYSKAVGPCPICGDTRHWINDVPLRAFCWGTEDSPHQEWSKEVPEPFNPYLPNYIKPKQLKASQSS